MHSDIRFTIAVFGESDALTADIQSCWSNFSVVLEGPYLIAAYLQYEWKFSAAIIDARYDAEVMLPLIDELEERAIPFVFFLPWDSEVSKPGPYILSKNDKDIKAMVSALIIQQPVGKH
ncbi:hypothetical protein G6L28_20000 [Agrobacterium larrymoorei]|uniref:hypothetical protein n=1 Tax=Agrobacterium larrymoorei TaxID=160699 RepID=UPI0015729BA4|nr:hypothetical protein [Agrobacterium larrymoorei]NTJ44879.1 hypothetical protein [Agrobacterium larrymoorei]